MLFSIIIPAYNANLTIKTLLQSIYMMQNKNFEVIVVDDCSTDNTINIVKQFPCRLICMTKNSGPACCRNAGVQNASGEILVFTDSDCKVDVNWLYNISKYFEKNKTDSLMGKVILSASNYLGDSISALGFPAGGAIGFDKIWKVDKYGYTNSLSTANCAVKKEVFDTVGGFDETFPFPGGEDSLFAHKLQMHNFKIRYIPSVIIYHESRNKFYGFIKWQFKRGISSYIFSKKIENKSDFLLLRLWSTKNIIQRYIKNIKLPLILSLIVISFFTQTTGFFYAKNNIKFK